MKGASAQDCFELFFEIVKKTAAKDTIDYLAVLDVTAATLDILYLHQIKNSVIERMRERRRDELALRECMILDAQRSAAKIQGVGYRKLLEEIDDPVKLKVYREEWQRNFGAAEAPLNAPPYSGAYSKADIEKLARPLESKADDGQAFLDSIEPLERIDRMIEVAEARQERAFEQIATRRQRLGEWLRDVSNRIIEGSVNPRKDDNA
jgi:hypothetical protein